MVTGRKTTGRRKDGRVLSLVARGFMVVVRCGDER